MASAIGLWNEAWSFSFGPDQFDVSEAEGDQPY